MCRQGRLIWVAVAALLLLTVMSAGAQSTADPQATATDAYVYGYSLVSMMVTERVMTNVTSPQPSGRAPVNQLSNVPEYPTPEMKDVVAPNVDTLYSIAWLDVSTEPIVLHVPDTHGRYYLMPLLDAYTNVFASPGKRTTGTKAGDFAIVGPCWTGTLPNGVTEIKAPTDTVWLIGRIQTNGPSDYDAVHAIQKQLSLVPLSAFGKVYSQSACGAVDPSVDMKTPPFQQVNSMDAGDYFKTMANAMKTNPPPDADASMLAKLKQLGIVPGQDFDISKVDPATARALQQSVKSGQAQIRAKASTLGTMENGWRVNTHLGTYGTDYLTRAAIAMVGLGANLPQDAVYPDTRVDDQANPLNGASNYVLHFAKGQTPPVNAFWSVTMYDPGGFLAPNSIQRYAISSWMPLKYNKDGSLDIYVQNLSPGQAKEANWLPAPAGAFRLTMRLYWPKDTPPSILDDTWKPPAVQKL